MRSLQIAAQRFWKKKKYRTRIASEVNKCLLPVLLLRHRRVKLWKCEMCSVESIGAAARADPVANFAFDNRSDELDDRVREASVSNSPRNGHLSPDRSITRCLEIQMSG